MNEELQTMIDSSPAAKIHPRGDRVLVKLVDFDVEDRERMIVRPDIAEEAPDKGVIVRVGPDAIRSQPGQVVLFGQYTGMSVADEYHLIREKEIIATVTDVRLRPHKRDEAMGGDPVGVDVTKPPLVNPHATPINPRMRED